jgi:hypothetical protein
MLLLLLEPAHAAAAAAPAPAVGLGWLLLLSQQKTSLQTVYPKTCCCPLCRPLLLQQQEVQHPTNCYRPCLPLLLQLGPPVTTGFCLLLLALQRTQGNHAQPLLLLPLPPPAVRLYRPHWPFLLLLPPLPPPQMLWQPQLQVPSWWPPLQLLHPRSLLRLLLQLRLWLLRLAP